MVSFSRIIDMGDFRLVKLQPTAQNAERLLSVINANREFLGEISYWLAYGFNGRGIMTRALNKLTEIGFANMGLQRIQLTLDKQNVRSAAVALRCGYECEGVLRKYFILRGQPRDMKMFSKVAV